MAVSSNEENFTKRMNVPQRKSGETSAEMIDGMALHKDLSFTDYKWTQPDSFTYKGETYRSKSFADIYIRTLELLIRDYPRQMANLPEKYPRWFKHEAFGTTTSKQLSNGVYAGTNYHRYDFAKFLQKIFDDLGLPRNTLIIDSHRDYQGYSHSQSRITQASKTEETVLRLNEDWSYKQPVSYTLRGKQTAVESGKWVDLYMSVLEDLIKIDPVKMKRLPSFDRNCFSYTDFPGIRFRVLSNGIRAAAGLQASQIEDMLRRLLSYLYIAPFDFKIQAISDKKDSANGRRTFVSHESAVVSKHGVFSAEEEFYNYLKNEKSMAESSCRSFVSSIRSAEKYAKKNNYSSTVLFTENAAEAERTNREMMGDPDFLEFDKEKRFRFTNAISKLMTFYRTRNK